jgi:hypothetical protein
VRKCSVDQVFVGIADMVLIQAGEFSIVLIV